MKNRTGDDVYLMDAKNGSTDDDYQCMFEPEYRDLGEIGFEQRHLERPSPAAWRSAAGLLSETHAHTGESS